MWTKMNVNTFVDFFVVVSSAVDVLMSILIQEEQYVIRTIISKGGVFRIADC
jgi:hypothetical protein